MSLAAPPRADHPDEEWNHLLAALAVGRARQALEDAVTALDVVQVHAGDDLEALRRDLRESLAGLSALTPSTPIPIHRRP